jgi:hypothetical protein
MTRANVYVCDDFVAELPSDAYPGGDWWELMLKLDGCTEAEFRREILTEMADYGKEYLPPESQGVGNWTYQFLWYPTAPLGEYREWERWKGRILVCGVNEELTYERFGSSYYQVPGPWVPIGEWKEKD